MYKTISPGSHSSVSMKSVYFIYLLCEFSIFFPFFSPFTLPFLLFCFFSYYGLCCGFCCDSLHFVKPRTSLGFKEIFNNSKKKLQLCNKP